jgi:DnaJ-class molecular chaperone
MAVQFKDYYEILGVPKNASEKEIKSAYRKLARQHHPDVNPGDQQAAERFREVAEAYEVLSDPEKRKRYDSLGPDWQRYARAGAGPAAATGGVGPGGARYEYRTVSPEDLEDLFGTQSPFSDFFQSIFGQTGRSSPTGRPTSGTRGFGGYVDLDDLGDLRGFGTTGAAAAALDVEAEVEVPLEEAYRGGGRSLEVRRPDGTTRRVEVRIPPGVQDGTRLRLAGQGETGPGGRAGDLYLRARIQPHPRYERRGDDLYTTVQVPLSAMMLGGEVPVPSLDGRTLTVSVPPETPNGRTLRLRGQGMPRLRQPQERGDLYVRCEVLLPSGLGEEERRLFRRLAEIRQSSARVA